MVENGQVVYILLGHLGVVSILSFKYHRIEIIL